MAACSEFLGRRALSPAFCRWRLLQRELRKPSMPYQKVEPWRPTWAAIALPSRIGQVKAAACMW